MEHSPTTETIDQPAGVLRVHPADNLLVARTALAAGTTISFEGEHYTLLTDVAQKHKFVTEDLPAGAAVRMYGVTVGRAVTDLQRGQAVTTENVHHAAAPAGGWSPGFRWSPPDVSAWQARTFMGYRRADGRFGTANYWLVVPLVFCENRNVQVLQEAFLHELGYYRPSDQYRLEVRRLVAAHTGHPALIHQANSTSEADVFHPHRIFPHVDGIKFLTHQAGCGGTRQDAQALCGLLAGYITHPNVVGATVLSLGCQNAQVEMLRAEITRREPGFDRPLLVFDQQQIGSEQQLLTQAIGATFEGLVQANQCRREPAPLSALTIGLECGGSDGFSGLSANPVVGHVADLLAAVGGSPVLAEFPELCGVEQELVHRMTHPALADKFLHLMRTYARRAEEAGSGFDMNPSPGNIKDGLITDAMKSAGAARKGGTSPIRAVLDYPERQTVPGLNLLCTPGNDVESTTALAGAGCQLILFTTGLGTPTGNPVASVLKVASNSTLATRMADLIDFDAGPVITGQQTIATAAEALLEQCLATASGTYVPRAVQAGQDDFIPWKRGVSL